MFPAHAGMTRNVAALFSGMTDVPRPRGDDPIYTAYIYTPAMFPAHAGMTRYMHVRACARMYVPRPRGDDPNSNQRYG